MAKLSKYHSNKTETKQKLDVLTEIVNCEGMLKSNSFTITSGQGAISGENFDSITSDIRISPELNNILHGKLLEAITGYMEELKKI